MILAVFLDNSIDFRGAYTSIRHKSLTSTCYSGAGIDDITEEHMTKDNLSGTDHKDGKGDRNFREELTGGGTVKPDETAMERYLRMRQGTGLDRDDKQPPTGRTVR